MTEHDERALFEKWAKPLGYNLEWTDTPVSVYLKVETRGLWAAWQAAKATIPNCDLQRFGLQWKGLKEFVCQPMADGHWTPWHIAAAAREESRRREEELREEIAAGDKLLAARDEVIKLIPPCSMHGYCLPHAADWIKDRIGEEELWAVTAAIRELKDAAIAASTPAEQGDGNER